MILFAVLASLLAPALTPSAFAYDHCFVGLVRLGPGQEYKDEVGREFLRKGYSVQFVDNEKEARQYDFRAKVETKCNEYALNPFYVSTTTTLTVIRNGDDNIVYKGSSPPSINRSCEPEFYSMFERIEECKTKF